MLAAYGTPLAFGAPTAVKAGGRLRVGIIPAPVGTIEPHTYADHGTLATGCICGRVPDADEADNMTSSRSSRPAGRRTNGTEWTFNLRQSVKFQDGQSSPR